MTAGGNTGLHKDFWNFAAWGLKPKKRQRSGSGGSTKDMENKKKSIIQLRKQSKSKFMFIQSGGRKHGGPIYLKIVKWQTNKMCNWSSLLVQK